MDQNGTLYIVGEDGGGRPGAPAALGLRTADDRRHAADRRDASATRRTRCRNRPPGARVKLATVTVADPDGFGENNLSVTGPDASHFEVDHNGLYLKAGTVLKASTQAEYEVSVAGRRPDLRAASPDATSAPYKLTVTPNGGGTSSAQIAITEVAPWSSGEQPVRRGLVRADQRRHDQSRPDRLADQRQPRVLRLVGPAGRRHQPGAGALGGLRQRQRSDGERIHHRLVPGRRARRLPDRLAARRSGLNTDARPGQHLRLDRGEGLRRRLRRLAVDGALRHLRQHRRARRRRHDRPDHLHAQHRRHERSLQRQRRQRNRLARAPLR